MTLNQEQSTSAKLFTDEIKKCVTLQTPTNISSIFLLTKIQAQYMDLDYYDHYFKPGAYLCTHMRKWHENSQMLQTSFGIVTHKLG
jgi:hypothetical protein